MKPTLFFLFLLLATAAYSQPTIQWQKCYGGTNDDVVNDMSRTSDNGYIMVGQAMSNNGDVTNNHGSWDVWVTKLDASGSIQWQRCYGGTNYETGTAIKQTNDGGYIFAGVTNSINGDVSGLHIGSGFSDVWVVKLDVSGNIQWQKCYGGTEEEGERVQILQISGGYIFTTTTMSNNGDVNGNHGSRDVWVVQLDNNGGITWQKCYGGSLAEFGYNIEQTADGGYIICGISLSTNGDLSSNYGAGDCWVLKITASGAISWQKNYGGSENDYTYSIHQCKDGGYVFTGGTRSNDIDVSGLHSQSPPNDDLWTVKTDATGTIEWAKTIGGTNDDQGIQIIESDDGSYVIGGYTDSYDGDVVGAYNNASNIINGDILLLSLYQNGSIKWLKPYGGGNPDGIGTILQTTDTGFIVAGVTKSMDGDATNGGFHNSGAGVAFDYWAVKFSSVLGVDDMNSSKLKVCPTITNGNVHVELPQGYENTTVHLLNLLGQEIKINTTTGLSRTIHIDNTPAGMYMLQLRYNGEVKNYRIVYQP
jgi:hypothetical protein